MKKAILLLSKILIISGIFLSLNCNKKDENTESTVLTEEEKTDLLQLREEEKLARDVYLYAYNKYGLTISINISNSEQTHMDKVLQILTNYNLEDPANTQIGVFNDTDLQNLYQQLITKVDESETDALIVGATIEDLDIKDIEDFILRTTKADILSMYENLMCGSRNHLRSYYSQIISNGSSYSSKYISQAEFDSIVNSDNEKCGQ
ncbi:MAG: DUF2202 domain-containing protein [Bacteroidales bacterium]|nr:DUF2202 domain-containing protein [Bacteroidales bacterium]